MKDFVQAFIIKKKQYYVWLPDHRSLQKVFVRSSYGSFVKLGICSSEAGIDHFDSLIGPF